MNKKTEPSKYVQNKWSTIAVAIEINTSMQFFLPKHFELQSSFKFIL